MIKLLHERISRRPKKLTIDCQFVFTNFIYTVFTHCALECSEGMVNFAIF